jgi:lambda family phage portal protein
MKRTIIDRMIGALSPVSELQRLRARSQTEILLRTYEAAQNFATDDWSDATGGSANAETQNAIGPLRSKGRDAIRNNPYAGRGLAAIVSNTVGSGIMPNIKGKTKLQTKRLNEAWKMWGETSLCDSFGRHNFYSLQALALRSTVESGEVVTLKEVNILKDTAVHQLRMLESDYIVDNNNASVPGIGTTIKHGIKLDEYDRPVSYLIYNGFPGESNKPGYREYSRERVLHTFRQDRPGQLRGVSWFHPVIRQLEDFKEYQHATLISKKIEACYSAIVINNDTDSTLSASQLKTRREAESMLSPGTFKYLNPGEDVRFSEPGAVSGYDEYCKQVLRAIASGLGITYEALTSDYSNVNFSSGRMGHIEFRRNVEMWRWAMLIPTFCEPGYEHFLEWCRASGIPTEGSSCEWIPPAWSMIDPTKEIAAFKEAVRSGFTSYPKAVREQGADPIELLHEIKDSNDLIDSLGIIIDSDPRRTTGAGILQVPPEQNKSSLSGDTHSEKNKNAPQVEPD